jgi:hypothetical protein
MTKRELAESIIVDVYGGQPAESSDITPRQVGLLINNALAEMAKKSFYENSNLEGVAYANDEFICTFSNIALNNSNGQDTSGYKWFDMPTAPVGLPKSRGIVFVGANRGAENPFRKIPASMISVYLTTVIPNTVYYWVEGSRGYVCASDRNQALPSTLRVKTIGSDANNLDAELSASLDAISEIHKMVVAQLRMQQQSGKDTTNDNLDINDVR